jgi:exocyst complex component 4
VRLISFNPSFLDYFKTFNDSIHTFSGVVETVADSQKRASQMRQALESSRDLLQTKRSDLMELWLKSVKFKEMLRMIDTIAELHDAPEKVDILLNQKYYLQALTTIQKSLHTMAAQEYSAVVALTDVRQNLERINSVCRRSASAHGIELLMVSTPSRFIDAPRNAHRGAS